MAVVEPRGDGDWDQFTELTARACGLDTEAANRRVGRLRASAVARFEVEADRVVAGALALPCHQYVGGRPVSAGYVCAPHVDAAYRGLGIGRRVMWSLADALDREGMALAPAQAAPVGFLRRLGWEVCGQSMAFSVPTAALAIAGSPSGELCDPDPDGVRALRRRVGMAWTGPVERPHWWASLDQRPGHAHAGWYEGDVLTGYLSYRICPADGTPTGRGARVVVSDLWAESHDALDGLLSVLGSERTVCETTEFEHGVLPGETAVRYRIDASLRPVGAHVWMLRVIDPETALAAAGWPTITGLLDLEVAALGRPASIMRVEFAGGTAAVGAGPAARVRMSSGAFAAWFAGALPATQAARLGIASGPAEDLAFMDLLVADRRPWLPDHC